jgi:hypothetical protein
MYKADCPRLAIYMQTHELVAIRNVYIREKEIRKEREGELTNAGMIR